MLIKLKCVLIFHMYFPKNAEQWKVFMKRKDKRIYSLSQNFIPNVIPQQQSFSKNTKKKFWLLPVIGAD